MAIFVYLSRNWKYPSLGFVQYLETGVIKDTKYGMSVSNEKFMP